jgi:hypothetical protein
MLKETSSSEKHLEIIWVMETAVKLQKSWKNTSGSETC